MKQFQLKFLSILSITALILSSCGGGGSKAEAENDAGTDFDEAKSQIISEIDQVIEDLPPPSEVPYLLMATGTDYDPTIVNTIDKVESYFSATSKAALNLGIYTTDIGYLASYEKTQESLNFITGCQKLAENLGIASALDLELIGRFERNLNNRDSLKVVVDDIIGQTGEKLNALDRMHVAGLVLTGTYIEGLYISTQLITNYKGDLDEQTKNLLLEPLIKIVIDQKPALNDLIIVMNSLSDNADVANLLTDLNALKGIYDGELAEVSEQITNNTGDLVLTTDVLNNLSDETARIRNSFVN